VGFFGLSVGNLLFAFSNHGRMGSNSDSPETSPYGLRGDILFFVKNLIS
jgi:hypothetical protein